MYPRKNRFYFLTVAIALFAGAWLLEKYYSNRDSDFVRTTVFAKKTLHQEEDKCYKFIKRLGDALSSQNSGVVITDSVFKNVEVPKNNFTYFIYSNDSITYWSNNNTYFAYDLVKGGVNQQLLKLKNGWYELFKYSKKNVVVIGLLLIKSEYNFQNQYLVNRFNPIFNLPDHATLSLTPIKGSYPIIKSTGGYLFSIKYNPDDIDPGKYWWIATMYFFAFAFFAFSILLFAITWSKKSFWASVLVLMILVGIRFLTIHFHFPYQLYNSPMFNPQFYASSFFLGSLGDFLLSIIVLSMFVLFFYYYFKEKNSVPYLRKSKVLFSLVLIFTMLTTFLFSVFINYLISGLIINSKISFNVNNIFELTSFSLIGFIIIGTLLFTFYLVCEGTVRFARKTLFTIPLLVLLFLITQGLFLGLLILLRDNEVFYNYGVSSFVLTNFLILFTAYIRFTSKKALSLGRSLLVVFAFSIYATYTIYTFNQRKEKDNLRLLVNKVESQQDLVAEYLFRELDGKIKKDNFIKSYFNSPNPFLEEKIKKRILTLYFGEVYWGRYDITVKAFDRNGISYFTQNDTTKTLNYYQTLMEKEGKPTDTPGFYYMYTNSGRVSYAGLIQFNDAQNLNSLNGVLVIELNSRFYQEGGGFPDLLISDKMPVNRDISNYSYARYQNGRLTYQFGPFSYFFSSDTYTKIYGVNRSEQFVNFGDYVHFIYRNDNNDWVIISHRTPTWLETITLFSYVFSFLTVMFLGVLILYRLLNSHLSYQLNFQKRIQLSVIVIVVAALTLIGGGTIYYIVKGYSDDQQVRIKEKLSSILLAIENELASNGNLSGAVAEDFSQTFSKLSNTLETDFNLFDRKGRLIFSTQSKIFDQEILSTLMNRRAYEQLVNYQNTSFIHYEDVGGLSFLSAYEPVRNAENKLIGYINLPYFARQTELKKEISSFLVSLINIYVLLFAISVLLTFIISNRLVKPLNLIQQKLGNIKFGKRNELIEWGAKDEIGALVEEYNKMVDQLARSADALAKSERESAWREMAKQVAHEIKNPLTPMKLSVQHLQRSIKDNPQNAPEIVTRVTSTLIEQIDTLSNIATEFSNFAKMPKAQNSSFELFPVIISNVDLYKETENININFIDLSSGACEVYADREQLIRVFSNLIKNAIQSIPLSRKGEISITLSQTKYDAIVKIEDNGTGMDDEVKSRIFTPNFTTKSAGSGLGLAMVKNILESAGGKIAFESTKGVGTVFQVTLPLNKNNHD